jgi:hypothetical protein
MWKAGYLVTKEDIERVRASEEVIKVLTETKEEIPVKKVVKKAK